MGTLALLGILVTIVAVFLGVQLVVHLSIQRVRLAEIAESVARELVELASVHTLGGSGVSVMCLTVPSEVYGQGYVVELGDLGNGRMVVRVRLQTYQVVRVVVVPNFGQSEIRAINGRVRVTELRTDISPVLLMPPPSGAGRPALVAVTQGDVVYLGFAVIGGG